MHESPFGMIPLDRKFKRGHVSRHRLDLIGLTLICGIIAASAKPVRGQEETFDSRSPSQNEAVAADSSEQVVATIDRLIREVWQDAEVRPSSPAPDGEWCRRVYLDIVGRTPSFEETNRFLSKRSRNRRAQLIDELLGDDHSRLYSQNWATIWTNLLIGRAGGQGRRALSNREGMIEYLEDSFYQNKPYDDLVRELIDAKGVNTPDHEDFNGAVNYLLAHLDNNGIEATARTARLFLGVQVQCTQCHGHPFNSWKQDQFWGLNAFFRQAKPLRRYSGRDIDHVRLADEDFADATRDATEAVVFFIDRSETTHAVGPTFVDGTKIDPTGYVDEVNRRDELARLVASSEFLPLAIVNRVWAHFFTYGFSKPVDDMGPHNPPSHPELLDYLASQFQAHGYDLKKLIRWIASSEAYSLSSRTGRGNDMDDPTAGELPLFSRFYIRQMRAEELYGSLLVATTADQGEWNDEQREQVRSRWLDQFVLAFGTDENDEATTFDGTIPQALMMMNGELVRRATQCKPGSFLHEVATADIRDTEKISRIYLAALARKPTAKERRDAQRLWKARGGDTNAALEDIWWALLNSNEFILKH